MRAMGDIGHVEYRECQGRLTVERGPGKARSRQAR